MPYAAIVAKPLRLLCSRIGFDHVNCYQMDSHHLSMLEGRQTLRRAGVPEVPAPAQLSARLLHQPPVSGGKRSPDSKNFLKITLDGLTQKTLGSAQLAKLPHKATPSSHGNHRT